MENIFLKILNMSLTAGWLVLAVLMLRLLFRRAPRAMSVVLWALVGLRLVLPFTFESKTSLVPSSEPVPPSILYEQEPTIHTGIGFVNSTINPVISQSMSPAPEASVNPMQVAAAIAAQVWLVGMVGMLLYMLISYLRLRHRVKEAMRLKDRIWVGDRIRAPFILGIFRPRIYLPSSLSEEDMAFVIAHEQAHLKRKDHWWKPLGFLLLSIHWFNPLLWVGYILLCRDIELACDEKVIRSLGAEAKKPYSETLLRCSVTGAKLGACPLAFGEVGVKQRIKGILHYKKPTLWILIAAVILTGVLAVTFLTDPETEDQPPETTAPTEAVTDPTEPTQESVTPQLPLYQLRQKFPEYFGLSTEKGLDVYVWQMGKSLYSWALLPGRDTPYELTELMDLHRSPASTDEMRAIVASYDLPREEITIIPFHMPYSSYYYEIDEQYRKEVEALFWQEEVGASENMEYTILVDRNNGGITLYYDIDDDGVKESLSLGPGPTSGVFTFTITATHEGEVEYFNTFASEFYDLRFVQDMDGRLLLEGTTQGEEPEAYLFEVTVVDGNIRISGNEPLAYWGEQGPDSPWAPKDDTLDSAIAEALEKQYRPDEEDGLFHCQSYASLRGETVSGTPTTDGSGNRSVTTLHLMVANCSYDLSSGAPELITVDITPAVMVLEESGVDRYRLVSYQVPDGETELSELFPDYLLSRVKQVPMYREQLVPICQEMAWNQLQKDS